MKPFPVDVFEVRKLGIEEWQKEFFWPVNDSEFFSLMDRISDAFRGQMDAVPSFLQDLLIANSGLIHQYASFLHARMVVERLRVAGYDILFSDRSVNYWEIMENRFKRGSSPARIHWSERLKGKGTQALKFVLRNDLGVKALGRFLVEGHKTVSLGSFSSLKREYCNKRNLLVAHRSSLDYFDHSGDECFDKSETRSIEMFTRNMLDRLREISEAEGLEFNELSTLFLEHLTRRQISLSLSLYKAVSNRQRHKADTLLLSEVAKTHNKTICLAVRRKFGTRVVGFEHGNTFGTLVTKYFGITELAHCDEYMVATSGSLPYFRTKQQASSFAFGRDTIMSSVDTNYYYTLWERNRSSDLPRRIQRIMVVGFPMNQIRYAEIPGHLSLMHLDLELRITRFLKQIGVEVVYKAHPDRYEEVKGFFDNVVDEVSSEPFERVYKRCDGYLFAHTDSSTFGIALCTNKPIIVMDIEGKKWNEAAYSLLAKRCLLVPARVDERNRIVFSEQELEAYLRAPIEKPDEDFVNQVMNPRAAKAGMV